jgi:UDP:flavonoid glycosyltransferase YjiC (YdhE family)
LEVELTRILLVSNSLLGLLHSSLELGRRLQRQGHEVIYSSPESTEALVRAHGLEFLPLNTDRFQTFLERDCALTYFQRWRRLQKRQAEAAKSLYPAEFASVLKERKPDLVLIDCELHEHLLTAMSFGCRTAALSPFVSMRRLSGIPPAHRMGQPGKGWRGSRPGAWLLWSELRFKKWGLRNLRRLQYVACDYETVCRLMARGLGMDDRSELDTGQWQVPFNYRRLVTLTLHSRDFEFPHEAAPTERFIGPLIPGRRPDVRMTDAERLRLDRLLELHESAGNGQKLIFAGFGSMKPADGDFLSRLVEVFGRRPGWTLLAGVGARAEEFKRKSIPQNVHLFKWLPQLEVLSKSDAAITHGAINTIDECVMYAVPSINYCAHETDMAGTCSRAEFHGLGRTRDASRDTVNAIDRALESMLTDQAMASRLVQMQGLYRESADCKLAEKCVDELLELEPLYPSPRARSTNQ